MKKYYINGDEKVEDEQSIHCDVCENGKKFEQEYQKTQKYQNDYAEFICEVCETKYKIPRIVAPKIIDENCVSGCPYVGETNCLNSNNDFYCYGNVDKFIEEVENMEINQDIEEKRNKFRETKKCTEHEWIESKPMKTPEGTFVFKSCAICKWAKVDYKNNTYEDVLTSLVNFIIHKGMLYEQQAKINEKTLDVINDIKETDIDNLFEEEIDLFSNIEQEEIELF